MMAAEFSFDRCDVARPKSDCGLPKHWMKCGWEYISLCDKCYKRNKKFLNKIFVEVSREQALMEIALK
jgi:hypothetical protein